MFNQKLKKRIKELEVDCVNLEDRMRLVLMETGFSKDGYSSPEHWRKPRFSVSEKANKILEYLKLEMIKTPGKVIPEKIIIKRIKTTPKKGRNK